MFIKKDFEGTFYKSTWTLGNKKACLKEHRPEDLG